MLSVGPFYWLEDQTYWVAALDYALTVGVLCGWSHLYYQIFLLLRFFRDTWKQSKE